MSEVQLTHHRLRDHGPRNLGLSGDEAPLLNPITEAGSGQVQEKEKTQLREIIEQLNTLYGNDMTDGDLLSFVNAVKAKTMESEVLIRQSANNTRQQFDSSPDLFGEIQSAVIDSMDTQAELSTRALNSPQALNDLVRVLMDKMNLYESLRAKATGA
ncbi:hypothetical protein KOR42_46860 [Thalassoglobus neptunius]|uniref:Uncharacterized protein n=1 Tax=Thalassoglobus neptunius TaxID=1938619 RepID=A0A5C5VVE1_9PLAN|nr:hypothetical protein [Thalassoglobus neptunius]TWT42636.1 hypothetical protein KOR42_46860 [Thalassoglobus neptunius]